MKYMISMYGSAAGMAEVKSSEWVTEMIAFMVGLDVTLRDTGELISNEGLSDGSMAKLVRLDDGRPVATDGPYATEGESIIGFWIVDVADEERAIEICAQIAVYSGVVELRPIPAGPPEQ